MKSSRVTYFFVLLNLFLIIVGGNILSFEVFGTSVRMGEALSIFVGILLLRYFYRLNIDKSIIYLLIWMVLAIVLAFINGLFIYGFPGSDIVIGLLYLSRFVYSVLFAFMVAQYAKIEKKQISLLKFLNFLYVVVCLIGFFQLVFYPVANDWYALFEGLRGSWKGDPHINRLVSTDFDPNYFASCLLIGIVVNLVLLRHALLHCFPRKKTKIILQYGIIFAIDILALFLTDSRSGILGLGLIIILYFCFNIRFIRFKIYHLIIIAAGILTCVYLLAFSDITVFVRIRNIFSDASAGARFISWAKGFQIMADTLFMGIGYNLYPAYNAKFFGALSGNTIGGTDSSLQLIVITTGVIGFVLLLLHLIDLWKGLKTQYAVKSLIIAALVICNFNNLLFYSLWVIPFYLLLYLTKSNAIEQEKNIFKRVERQAV